MSLAELSKFTIVSKYAKYLPKEKRREDWSEATERCRDMHLRKYDFLPEESKEKIKEVFKMVEEKRVAPSMRSMQFGGEAIERKNARMYNCCALHIYDTRSIEKAFWLLLCGCGVGLGFKKSYVERFPKLVKKSEDDFTNVSIPDTIEGWANSTRILIDSYLEGNEWSGTNITFDYSQIREKGEPLSIGGKAPGSEGLRQSHRLIASLIEKRQSEGLETLRTIDWYDILMHCSDAVLSGGIRRSATLALFDIDDELMMNAKTGNWFEENPQRARSNNSVMINRQTITQEKFQEIFFHTQQFGEPGFVFVNDENTLFNPCAEIGFIPLDGDDPAVQFCNLSIVNGNKVKTEQDFMKAVEAATIIGTLQAGYTDFPFLDEKDRKVTEEEALLGVSVLGWLSDPSIFLDWGLVERASAYAVKVNEEWAEKIGINPAARVTCIKPDGNSAAALESPFSGIHPAHSRKYFRRVQVNKEETPYQHYSFYNSSACEPSVYSANNTDDVMIFPIEVETDSIFKDDLTAIEHLDIIKKVQQYWVNAGQKNNKKDVSNSVSCTVLVDSEDWLLVARYLYENKGYFSTVSFLPRTGDKIYKQSPYEAVVTEQDLELFERLKKQIIPVDYSFMREEEDSTSRSEELACVGGACAF